MSNKKDLAAAWLINVDDNTADGFDYKKIIGDSMEFEITDTLSAKGLMSFLEILRADSQNTGLGHDEIEKMDMTYKQSSSTPHADTFLKKILIQKDLQYPKNFKIGFSEPQENSLRADLWHTYFSHSYKNRFGDTLMILFLFNADGTVKKWYFQRVIH
jgi:hypothetical protein